MPHTPGHYDYLDSPGGPKTVDEGDLYPLENPAMAFRNYLRSSGKMGNIFNPAFQRWQQKMMAQILPAFLMNSMGYMGDIKDVGMSFKDFMGKYVGGEIPRMSMMGAQQGLGSISDLINKVGSAVSTSPLGEGMDLNDPAARNQIAAQMMARGQMNPLEAGLAGLSGDPQMQMKMMLGAYLPSMGTGLTEGMGKVYGPMSSLYEEYFNPLEGGPTPTDPTFTTLLDFLAGRKRGIQ